MEPIEAYYLIRKACLERPELKFKDPSVYNDEIQKKYFQKNPFMGFCYVASMAFYHFVPEAEFWAIGRGHYFNKIDGKVWDLTAEQFHQIMPYAEARKVPRRKLTKRAQMLVDHIML